MRQNVEVIFIPASTGGTLAGIGRFFRETLPSAQIVGVDAKGSIIFGSPPAPRKLTGIGSSRTSTFLQGSLYDEAILVKDEEAFAFCRFLSVATGITVGGSSGAVLAACSSYLAKNPEKQNVICICAVHGKNYRSSIFNDQWLQKQGIQLSRVDLGPVDHIHAHPIER